MTITTASIPRPGDLNDGVQTAVMAVTAATSAMVIWGDIQKPSAACRGRAGKGRCLFEPGFDPDKIGKKLVRKRVKLFRQGGLGRLIIDALRRAGKPLGTQEITTALLAVGGYGESARPSLGPRVRGNLAYQVWCKTVKSTGSGRTVTWALVEYIASATL